MTGGRLARITQALACLEALRDLARHNDRRVLPSTEARIAELQAERDDIIRQQSAADERRYGA